MHARLENSLRQNLELVRGQLLAERMAAGHWTGELSESALSTATAISALSFYQQAVPDDPARVQIDECIRWGLNWLYSNQNSDGGWGDTSLSYSNISTSMLVRASFEAAGQGSTRTGSTRTGSTRTGSTRTGSTRTEVLGELDRYIEESGGVTAIKTRYGQDKTFAVPILANCAMAGMVKWQHVDAFPFEVACIPQSCFRWARLPVVSYAIPALVAIGQVKFRYDPPRNPFMRWLRRAALTKSLQTLDRMQPQSGGFLEAIPLTSFVCMSLIKCGLHEHSVVQKGIQFLRNTFRRYGNTQGAWPIDTNLATWVTTLSVNALANDSNYDFNESDATAGNWHKVLAWILGCQYKDVHPFTGAQPGGWGWSDLTGAVPDADDTPGAMLALSQLSQRLELSDDEQERVSSAAEAGVSWLLDLQNRDRGWPTFCRGWGRFPFDRSGNDLTAHVLRALLAWQEFMPSGLRRRSERAIERGFEYLSDNQHENGYWLPLWFGNQDQVDEINPFYGTAKVLLAYHEGGRLDTKPARIGLEWIRENQNVDGGWGGGPGIKSRNDELISSIEETALCTEALALDDDPCSRPAFESGLQWLNKVVESGEASIVSPIGFYFAKLWYFEKLYPLIFATSALGLASTKLCRQATENLD